MRRYRTACCIALCAMLCTTGIAPAAVGGTTADRIRTELEASGLADVPNHVIETLSTLEKIDAFPIYTMTYFGPYVRKSELLSEENAAGNALLGWGCSLFAALGDADAPVFGRNFDWVYSPLLIVFLVPESGNRSIMSVDLAYLVEEEIFDRLDAAAGPDLLSLLNAPFIPFDGMNEHGLAIGMASVDYDCGYPVDPGNRDVGDLLLMREVLEGCATVEEAIAFLDGVNPVNQGGPKMHYLIADATPAAALIEYDDGDMHVLRAGETPWQLGTNFPVLLAEGGPQGHCWRYDTIERTLHGVGGRLGPGDGMSLLEAVSTEMTQWSLAYAIAERHVYLSVGRSYDTVFDIALEEREAERLPHEATP
jgi:hypothetical protein